MASVDEHIPIPVSADEAWPLLRDFGAIHEWAPPIADADVTGEGVGAERTLTLADGGQVVERLEALDDESRTLRYVIVESPLPVEGYEGTLSVRAVDATSCEVTWASTFEVDGAPAEEMVATFAELYTAGLSGLRTHLTGG
jgi:hypothetical protein